MERRQTGGNDAHGKASMGAPMMRLNGDTGDIEKASTNAHA